MSTACRQSHDTGGARPNWRSVLCRAPQLPSRIQQEANSLSDRSFIRHRFIHEFGTHCVVSLSHKVDSSRSNRLSRAMQLSSHVIVEPSRAIKIVVRERKAQNRCFCKLLAPTAKACEIPTCNPCMLCKHAVHMLQAKRKTVQQPTLAYHFIE
jgi:hypothetical protein